MGCSFSSLASMVVGGDPDLPARQKWLRDACCEGDIGKVQRLLNPKLYKWHRWLTYLLTFGDQQPATLDFIYVDDRGRQPLHYVVSGISHTHRLIEPLYNVPDTTIPGKHPERRAQLLTWILDQDLHLDLNAVDMRGKSVVQWAVLSQSLEVLEVLVRKAQQRGIPVDVTAPDHTDTSALDIALASQQWTAVQLLIQSGALSDNSRLKNAMSTLAEFAPDVIAVKRAEQPPDAAWSTAFSSCVSSMVSSLFPSAPITQPDSPSLPKVDSHASVVTNDDEEVEVGSEDVLGSFEQPQVFTSMQEVEEFWNAQARHLSALCSVDVPTAHRLLRAHNHDFDAAIRACLLKLDDATTEGSGPPPEHAFRQCIVCYDDINPSNSPQVDLPCNHPTCNSCWENYVKARLEDGLACNIQCPEPGCQMTLSLSDAQQVLSPSMYSGLQRAVLQSYVDSNPNIKWCPRPGCGNSITLAHELERRNIKPGDLKSTPLTVRCKCGYSFCWHCLEESHEPALCYQVKNWRSMLEEEKKECEHHTATWMQHNTQRCCNCGCHVQRSDGCNHMKCTVCGQHFCYVCGQDWASHGPQTGGFYACTVMNREKSDASTSIFTYLADNVTKMLQKAFKFLTRQEMYMRRYIAQTDDNQEVNRVLQHILRILVAGLPAAEDPPTDDAGGGDAMPTLSLTGSSPTSSEASVHTDEARAGEGSPLADDDAAADSAAAQDAADDAALAKAGLAAAESFGAQLVHGPANTKAAGHTMGDAGPGEVEQEPVKARHASGLAARVPAIKRFLTEWERTVAQGRQVLRNSYIATYFMERCNERQYLESMQVLLESQVGQLAALLSRMPHRRDILEDGAAADAAEEHAQGLRGGPSLIARCVVLLLQICGRAVLCFGHRLISMDSYRSISLMSLQGHQVRDQFYYVVALHLHRARIIRLLRQVNRTCHSIVQAGRNKHHKMAQASSSPLAALSPMLTKTRP